MRGFAGVIKVPNPWDLPGDSPVVGWNHVSALSLGPGVRRREVRDLTREKDQYEGAFPVLAVKTEGPGITEHGRPPGAESGPQGGSKDTGTSVLQPQGLGELGDGFSGPGCCQTVPHLVGGGERSRAGLQSWVQVGRAILSCWSVLVCAGLCWPVTQQ